MKLFAKVALAALVGGTASIYAGTGGVGGTVAGNVSSADMFARAEALHGKIIDQFRDVEQMQIAAKKDKDVIKLNCLNDKLVEMKPEVNIAEHSQMDLQSAQGSSDQQAAFSALSQAADTVDKLHEAAQQCAGKPLLTSESANEVTHPPIDQPPTYGSVETGGIEPPAYASPIN